MNKITDRYFLGDEFIVANWHHKATAITTTKYSLMKDGEDNIFNLKKLPYDDGKSAIKNRQVLQEYFMLKKILWLDQRHTSDVLVIEKQEDIAQECIADASISYVKGIACAALTADCLPILLTNKSNDFVAAIHAGWKGLSKHIIHNLINKVNDKPSNISVWLGPTISTPCYEVDDPVRDAFVSMDAKYDKYFRPKQIEGKYLFSLSGLAFQMLNDLGVHSIYGGGFCTFSDNRLFSHRKNPNKGNLASIIWM